MSTRLIVSSESSSLNSFREQTKRDQPHTENRPKTPEKRVLRTHQLSILSAGCLFPVEDRCRTLGTRPAHRLPPPQPSAMPLAEFRVAGRLSQLDYAWIGPSSPLPTLVFLHEGLGSVSAWKNFPATLCERLGRRGLVFSRPGYGESTPRAKEEK